MEVGLSFKFCRTASRLSSTYDEGKRLWWIYFPFCLLEDAMKNRDKQATKSADDPSSVVVVRLNQVDVDLLIELMEGVGVIDGGVRVGGLL